MPFHDSNVAALNGRKDKIYLKFIAVNFFVFFSLISDDLKPMF